MSARLGHASANVTNAIYSHVLPGDDEQAALAGAALLGGSGLGDSHQFLLRLADDEEVLVHSVQPGKRFHPGVDLIPVLGSA